MRIENKDKMMDDTTKFMETLLYGNWQYLLNVRRYTQHPMTAAINVPSHCWIMSILAIQIMDEIFDKEKFDKDEVYKLNAEVQRKIALHDIEECIIGDIPRLPDENLRKAVKALKVVAIESVNEFCFNRKSGYEEEIKMAKFGASGLIVEYVDMLSALIEVLRDKSLGNTNVDWIISHATSLLTDIVDEWRKKNIEPLQHKSFIEDALEILYEINEKIARHIKIYLALQP